MKVHQKMTEMRFTNMEQLLCKLNDRTDSYQIWEVGRDDVTSLPRMDIRDIG